MKLFLAFGLVSVAFTNFAFASVALANAAQAKMVYLSYETKTFNDQYCGFNNGGATYIDSIEGVIEKARAQYNLHDTSFYNTGASCDSAPSALDLSISALLEGADSDVKSFIASSATTYQSDAFTIAFTATDVQDLDVAYYLSNMDSTHELKVQGVFVRHAVSLEDEMNFVQSVCTDDIATLKAALKGSPKEAEALKFIDANPQGVALSYVAAITRPDQTIFTIKSPTAPMCGNAAHP